MSKAEQTIQKLYRSFAEKDFAAMAALYHKKAVFNDPVFSDLQYAELTAMWEMFCRGTPSLKVTLLDITSLNGHVTARWQAEYVFPATGRKVVNRIKAEFTFKDGLIYQHTDHFNFYRWAVQAFGLRAVLLAWLPVFRQRVKYYAMHNLLRFMQNRSQSAGKN